MRFGDCPCGCDDCPSGPQDDAAAAVRGWLETERAKPASDITPDVAALFERCAEDLEVG